VLKLQQCRAVLSATERKTRIKVTPATRAREVALRGYIDRIPGIGRVISISWKMEYLSKIAPGGERSNGNTKGIWITASNGDHKIDPHWVVLAADLLKAEGDAKDDHYLLSSQDTHRNRIEYGVLPGGLKRKWVGRVKKVHS